MSDPKAHEAALAPALPDILAMAQRVVDIDSGSYDAAGVNAVIDIWAGMLHGLGFTIERAPLPGRGDQMTAHLALGNGPRVLILGHADTVWPAGTVAQWPFARTGDRITGPGVGDMKTNVVMALFVLRHLLGQGLTGLGSITMLIVPDEEIGSPQSRDWIESHARHADLCLTLEPCRPGGGVVVGRGAVGAVYLRATGVTAHCGSYREHGASAVSTLAALVAPLEALSDAARRLTATVGIFRGGAARQVVPGEAEIHLDLRAPDAAGAEALLAKVREIAARPPAIRSSLRNSDFCGPVPSPARITGTMIGGFSSRVPSATATGVWHSKCSTVRSRDASYTSMVPRSARAARKAVLSLRWSRMMVSREAASGWLTMVISMVPMLDGARRAVVFSSSVSSCADSAPSRRISRSCSEAFSLRAPSRSVRSRGRRLW